MSTRSQRRTLFLRQPVGLVVQRTGLSDWVGAYEASVAIVVLAPELIWEFLEQTQMNQAACEYLRAQSAFENLPEYQRAKNLPALSAWEVLQDLKLQVLI